MGEGRGVENVEMGEKQKRTIFIVDAVYPDASIQAVFTRLSWVSRFTTSALLKSKIPVYHAAI